VELVDAATGKFFEHGRQLHLALRIRKHDHFSAATFERSALPRRVGRTKDQHTAAFHDAGGGWRLEAAIHDDA
jgi:hypothetical protein